MTAVPSKADESQRSYVVAPADVVRVGSEPEDKFAYTQYSGHRVSYRYRVGDDWYASSEWFRRDLSEDSLLVCTLPDDPDDHVATIRFGGERCGRTDVSAPPAQEAAPARPPAGG